MPIEGPGFPFGHPELANLAGSGQAGLTQPIEGLYSKLAAHWDLEEASGNRFDTHFGRILTPQGDGTLGRTAGKINFGASLVQSSAQYLSMALGPYLTAGYPMSFSVHVKLTALPSNQSHVWPIVYFFTDSFRKVALRLLYHNGAWRFVLQTSSHLSGGFGNFHPDLPANAKPDLASDPVTANVMHHVVCSNDLNPNRQFPNAKIRMMFNGVYSESPIGGWPTALSERPTIRLGSGINEALTMDGTVDLFAVWYDRALLAGDMTALYAEGEGLAYNLYGGSPRYNLDTLSSGLWAYYRMDEDAEATLRLDATKQGNNLVFQSIDNADQVAGYVTPWANAFGPAEMFARSKRPGGAIDASMNIDPMLNPWAFVLGVYLTTPVADTWILRMSSSEDPDQPAACGLRILWNGSILRFQQHAGYFADGNPYYNEIAITGLSAPINQWFLVQGSFRGPSNAATYPIESKIMTLRVNDLVTHVPALCLDAIIPPVNIGGSNHPWILGSPNPIAFVGRIATTALYNRALANEEMDLLYGDGAWLILPW